MRQLVEKKFAYTDHEQKTALTWSLSAANIDHGATQDCVNVRFANVFELVGWARIFRRTFGYLPAEIVTLSHTHTDTMISQSRTPITSPRESTA